VGSVGGLPDARTLSCWGVGNELGSRSFLRARVSKSLSGASPGVSSRPLAQNADGQAVLKAASTRLQGKFHFHTMTIQIEDYSEDMKDCQACQGPSD